MVVTKIAQLSDTLQPPVQLLAKLGSIVAHVEEGSGAGGHAYDWVTVRSLVADREVQLWLKHMRDLTLIPLPRK